MGKRSLDQQLFDVRSATTLFLRALGIHEGVWCICVEFRCLATNSWIDGDATTTVPANVTRVERLGLQRAPQGHPLAVDASMVNPLPDLGDWDRALEELFPLSGEGDADGGSLE